MNVFLGDHHKNFICRRCLNSYTNENALKNHKEKCREDNICTRRTPNASHFQCKKKKHFHKDPLSFRKYEDFEADNEIDNSNVGNKTTNIYNQIPVLNGYRIEYELDDIFQSCYYESPRGYNNVDWYVNEVQKLENKMAFKFKNTMKDITMTQKDKEDFENNNICRFCGKNIESDKVRDHCHLTGNYRGPAHNVCNINASQHRSNIIPIVFHSFSNYDCHMFF